MGAEPILTVNEIRAKMTAAERVAAFELEDDGVEMLEAHQIIWARRRPQRPPAPVMQLRPASSLLTKPRPPEPAQSPPTRTARVVQFNAAQLQRMTFPPVRYVVPGYVAEGLTLLAGKPKLGKSWLALDWCIAVARGGFVFGDVKCPEGDVLYCALEDNPRRLKSRIETVLGYTEAAWPSRLTIWTEIAQLADGGLDAMRAWITSQPKPSLIVVDVLNKVRSARGNGEDAYAYDYKSMTPLKELADEFGIAVVVIHHTRKMGADDQLEVVSGTNGITGAADTILVLDRRAEGVTLYGRGRDIEEIETAVEFQRDNCRWRVLGDAAEVRRSDERTVILDALREAGGDALSPREVTDVTTQSYQAVRQLLVRMAKAGEIVRAGRGRYALPDQTPSHNGHKVTNEDDEEDEG